MVRLDNRTRTYFALSLKLAIAARCWSWSLNAHWRERPGRPRNTCTLQQIATPILHTTAYESAEWPQAAADRGHSRMSR